MCRMSLSIGRAPETTATGGISNYIVNMPPGLRCGGTHRGVASPAVRSARAAAGVQFRPLITSTPDTGTE